MGKRRGARSDVPVSRSREKITEVLKGWGCRQIGWVDDFDEGRCEVQFVFLSDAGQILQARFRIDTTPPEGLTKAQGESDLRGRFRTLLYWLQACLDAIDLGIIEPEDVFLPWLVTTSGDTVGEVLRDPAALEGGARLQLAAGRS